MKNSIKLIFLVLFVISLAAPRGAFAVSWYNASWDYRVKITVEADEVDADLTNFPVYVNLANLPAGFHTNVNQTDARDIRVTKADGTTELAREVVSYTAASDTGELHFLADALSNTTDTDFYIYYGNAGASDYGVTDTYGRNAVWADYDAVYHLQTAPTGSAGDVIDATGNVNDMTSVAMDSGNLVDGKLGGKGFSFNGTDEYAGIASALVGTLPVTVTTWVQVTGALGTEYTFFDVANSASTAVTQRQWVYTDNGLNTTSRVASSNATAQTIDITQNTWFYGTSVWNSATDRRIYLNGANKVTNTTSRTPTGLNRSRIANKAGSSSANLLVGYMDEVRVRSWAPSDAWVAAEYSNQSVPTTFYAVGAEENAPVTSIAVPFWLFFFEEW